MHELSIAANVVEAVEEAARRADASKVVAVTLRLGALSGVVADALRFCYDVATLGTLLEGSELLIHEVPVAVHCGRCGREAEQPGPRCLDCPSCGTPGTVVRGRELEIESIEIEGHPTE